MPCGVLRKEKLGVNVGSALGREAADGLSQFAIFRLGPSNTPSVAKIRKCDWTGSISSISAFFHLTLRECNQHKTNGTQKCPPAYTLPPSTDSVIVYMLFVLFRGIFSVFDKYFLNADICAPPNEAAQKSTASLQRGDGVASFGVGGVGDPVSQSFFIVKAESPPCRFVCGKLTFMIGTEFFLVPEFLEFRINITGFGVGFERGHLAQVPLNLLPAVRKRVKFHPRFLGLCGKLVVVGQPVVGGKIQRFCRLFQIEDIRFGNPIKNIRGWLSSGFAAT